MEILPQLLSLWDEEKQRAIRHVSEFLSSPTQKVARNWAENADASKQFAHDAEEATPEQLANMTLGHDSGGLDLWGGGGPSQAMILGAGKKALLGRRIGQIDPVGGAHFALRGTELYNEPAMGKYNLAGINVWHPERADEALPIYERLMEHPQTKEILKGDPEQFYRSPLPTSEEFGLTGEQARQTVEEGLAAARAGKPNPMYFWEAEALPLRDVVKEAGYGGYLTREADDLYKPTTAMIWDLAKVRPRGEGLYYDTKEAEKFLRPRFPMTAYPEDRPFKFLSEVTKDGRTGEIIGQKRLTAESSTLPYKGKRGWLDYYYEGSDGRLYSRDQVEEKLADPSYIPPQDMHY